MRIMACTALLLTAASSIVRAQEEVAVDSAAVVEAATRAATAWLLLVDEQNYEESWKQASELLRAAVTVETWESAALQVLDRFGPRGERTLLRAEYSTTLPNAPPGQYVLIEYRTAISGDRTLIETVVPMLESDGIWRVSGWSLRPE